jgi:hypothetical protein
MRRHRQDSTFSSKAYGTRTDKDIGIEGRIQVKGAAALPS